MKRMQKTKEVVRMQKRSGGEMAVVGTRKAKNAIKANKTVGSKKRRKPNGERKRTRSPRVKRNYKDSMFRMLFTDKKNLLSLYNAINGTNYTSAEDLEINTLENVIYMGYKNDISFVIDFQLHLYEHQASINPNMPLRDLFYASEIL